MQFNHIVAGLVLLALGNATAASALDLPEVGISYSIEVSMDPATRELSGQETLHWTNPSSTRTIARVPLHLYLNGFSNTASTWMQSAPIRVQGIDKLLKKYPHPWGYSDPVLIRQGDRELAWKPIAPDDANPNDRSLIEVTLEQPVPPGGVLELHIGFDARLPVPMARTGGREVFFVVGQWFPKIAVFEREGMRGATQDHFNAHQFFGKTEFYADYADYDVRIGMPEGWQAFATGEGGAETVQGTTHWHHFRQHAVPDFVWVTGTELVASVATHQPAGAGAPVQITVVVPKGTENQAPRWRKVVEASLDVLGARVGPYPWSTLTLVAPPSWASATGGMEYPTLILGGTGDPMWDRWPFAEARIGELTVAHEFSHQYFAFLLATNEFEEAYMDEGFTEYWGDQIMISMYGEKGGVGKIFDRDIDVLGAEALRLPKSRPFPRPVWARPSFLAGHPGAFTQFYAIPALTMATAARLFGQETVDRVFAAYFQRWKYAHPRFEDYLAVAREVGGDAFADFVAEVYTREKLPDYRVASMKTKRWEHPKGRLVTEQGIITAGAEESDDNALLGLDPRAREVDGKIVMRILDPGFNHAGVVHAGSVERRSVPSREGKKDPDWKAEENVFQRSTVRVEGPGWDHFPTDVEFRFADGRVIDDHWDGRSGYRLYSFLRAAPLSEVRIDPENRNRLDPDRVNNARLRKADKTRSGDWARWLGAVMQLFSEGVNQWL